MPFYETWTIFSAQINIMAARTTKRKMYFTDNFSKAGGPILNKFQ